MKKITVFACVALMTASMHAQTVKNSSQYVQCTGFYETIPVKDMPAQTEEQSINGAKHHEEIEARREEMEKKRRLYRLHKTVPVLPDPVLQSTMGSSHAVSQPLVNFDGGNDNQYCPNDPNGAVGPNDFVQMYNSAYAVYSKAGKLLTSGQIDLASIFTNIPGDDGDPVVLYDKFADRWFLSEFQVSTAPCGFDVAISETNDPLGKYYVYKFMYSGWNTNNYPDYPKFSIWSDGYYVTANLDPQQLMVLDRTRMLAGKQSAGMIVTNYTLTPAFFGGNNSLWNDPKVMDCDASALPPYGTPAYLTFFQNVNAGGASNMIIIDKLVHDTTAKTLTISQWDSLAPASFNTLFNPSGNFNTLAEPGVASLSNNAVDALDGAFNFRVPYLVFTGYNSVVLSNTVNVGHTVAGIRWYELRQNTSTMHFSIYQQGTFSPGDGINRWNGAIAMDQDGDIGLAYSADDSINVYPGLRYTGRVFGDPLGVMTAFETTAIAGSSPAINCGNRWGDYSDMTLDTDGLTFWYTNQYDKASNPNNRIFSFKIAGVIGMPNLIDATIFKAYQDGSNLNIMATTLPSNADIKVDLFEASGRQISTQTVTPAGNAFKVSLPIADLATGIYFVRMGNINYQRVAKVLIKK